MKLLNFILVLLIGIQAEAQPTPTGILNEVNRFRKAQGLAPAKLNAKHNQAAQLQAEWIATTGIFSHKQTISANGLPILTNPWDRGTRVGASVVAENLYQLPAASATSAHIVSGWIQSPGHRENMLYRVPDEIECRVGIAIVRSKVSPDEIIVVLVIGDNVDHQTGQIQN